MQELDQAPFGIIGLETSLGLVVTKLIEPGHLDWPTAIAKMTINPARILNLNKGTLQIGADADITVIDPNVRWKVDPAADALQEQQHAVRRLGIAGPGGGCGGGREGEVEESMTSHEESRECPRTSSFQSKRTHSGRRRLVLP